MSGSPVMVKICGLRRMEDILAANRCRPDYIGFVFAPSKRQVSPQAARELRRALDPAIRAVGVFVNQEPAAVAESVALGAIDLVQLHGDEDGAYIRKLKALLPPGSPVIKALRVGGQIPPIPEGADYLLFDSLSHRARGGTGETFDWTLLREIPLPYFLAGGIGLDNVAAALRAAAPHCVDVSSAVETDGWKDAEKMQAMVNAVRLCQCRKRA